MIRPTTHTRLARFGLITDGPRILVLPGGPPLALFDPEHAAKLATLLEHGISLDLALRAVRASQVRTALEPLRGAA